MLFRSIPTQLCGGRGHSPAPGITSQSRPRSWMNCHGCGMRINDRWNVARSGTRKGKARECTDGCGMVRSKDQAASLWLEHGRAAQGRRKTEAPTDKSRGCGNKTRRWSAVCRNTGSQSAEKVAAKCRLENRVVPEHLLACLLATSQEKRR